MLDNRIHICMSKQKCTYAAVCVMARRQSWVQGLMRDTACHWFSHLPTLHEQTSGGFPAFTFRLPVGVLGSQIRVLLVRLLSDTRDLNSSLCALMVRSFFHELSSQHHKMFYFIMLHAKINFDLIK